MAVGSEQRASCARIETVLQLLEIGEQMLRQRIRRENPAATDDEIEAEVRAWYQRSRGPELGAATGRVRTIDP